MEWVVFLRHGRRFIIAGAVIGLLAGAVVGARSRPLYQARTEVLVRPVLVDPFQATDTAGRVINMYTERQRAGSAGVAEKARARMHSSEDLRTIRSHLRVTVTGSTQLLAFAYRHDRPEQAQQGAQAFAEAYLATQRETATVLRDDRLARLHAELAPLDAAITEAEVAVGKAPARSAEASAAKARLRDLTTQAQPYRQTLASIASVDVAGGGTIVSNARRPTQRGGPSPATGAAAGLVLGLLAGGLAAFARPGGNLRLWERADVEEHLGAPVLGTLPAGNPDGVKVDDAHRLLRTRVQLMAQRQGHRCILVVSPTHHSSSGAVAAKLAMGLDRAGRRVVVVSSVAAHSSDMTRFLAEQREASDFVIIDAAPALEASDFLAFIHTAQVDGVLVVADTRHTRRDQLIETRRQLEGTGVPILGAVMLRSAVRERTALPAADMCPVPSP